MKFSKFTLMELIVVIAVLAILLSMLLPSFARVRKKARISAELSSRQQIYLATCSYAKSNNFELPSRDGAWIEFLHQTKDFSRNPTFDFNTQLFDKYLGEGEKIRTNIMFCDSTLFKIRNPKVDTRYVTDFTTLSYYQIPGNGSLLESGFQNRTFPTSEPSNPLWSCVIIDLGSGAKWFGHDAAKTVTKPTGASTVFMDGSTQWMRTNTLKPLWKRANYTVYRPVR